MPCICTVGSDLCAAWKREARSFFSPVLLVAQLKMAASFFVFIVLIPNLGVPHYYAASKRGDNSVIPRFELRTYRTKLI